MSKKTIWEYLKAKGFSDIAAAAIMGNMEAESNCIAVRLQGDFTAGFGLHHKEIPKFWYNDKEGVLLALSGFYQKTFYR